MQSATQCTAPPTRFQVFLKVQNLNRDRGTQLTGAVSPHHTSQARGLRPFAPEAPFHMDSVLGGVAPHSNLQCKTSHKPCAIEQRPRGRKQRSCLYRERISAVASEDIIAWQARGAAQKHTGQRLTLTAIKPKTLQRNHPQQLHQKPSPNMQIILAPKKWPTAPPGQSSQYSAPGLAIDSKAKCKKQSITVAS